MSATVSQAQAQTISPGCGMTAPEPSAVQVDASCRPLLLLFVSAAAWLLAASVIGLIASLKFHSPNILAGCPVLTYGRVRPAALDAFLYGFALQAGMGVLIWINCHLGRARLAVAPLLTAGWFFWNIGVTFGVLGIFAGDNTGYEWLEMPRYGSAPLFFGYAAIGIAALISFHFRSRRELYTSQWFLLAALFWFPWIYTTARALLTIWPVRGTMQSVVDWWYINNLTTVCFGFVGLGAVFYFVPKIVNRPLYSHYLGIFIFWTLALFGSWGFVPTAAPVPAWIPALSTLAALLTIVPMLAVAINVLHTLCGRDQSTKGNVTLSFVLFGATAFVIAGLLNAVCSLANVSEITAFTWFDPARVQIFLFGFFAMTMFGTIYYIIPRLVPAGSLSSGLIRLHFWLGALGIILFAGPLLIGGLKQGSDLNNAGLPFLNVVQGTLGFLRASTTGELLILLGNAILVLNIVAMLVRVGRASATAAWAANSRTAEVAS